MYKNNTETNLQLGVIKPLKYDSDTTLRKKILEALNRAEINIKRYNPEYWMASHVKDEIIKELYNELK